MVENAHKKSPLSTGEILIQTGYSPGIANNPQMVTEAPGFKQALADLGLTENLIAKSLVYDIEHKPKNRVKELALGADILKMRDRKPEAETQRSSNTYNFIFQNEKVQSEIRKTEAIIKEQLIKGHDTNTIPSI